MCALASGAALAQPKIPPKYAKGVSPLDIARLPKYCYNQYVDGALGGYQFSIPHESCGPAMNHFCPALIAMMQAEKLSLPKAERVAEANHARIEVDYTIRDMKPGCFITKDVLAAKQKAEMLVRTVK